MVLSVQCSQVVRMKIRESAKNSLIAKSRLCFFELLAISVVFGALMEAVCMFAYDMIRNKKR